MSGFHVKIAETCADLDCAYRLRRQVFVDEMGAAPGTERDRFDPGATHFLLFQASRAVGTLRAGLGGAYTAQEFDLRGLPQDPRGLAEIGRMCLHPHIRGGVAGLTLLSRAVAYLRARDIGLLVGTGSFAGAQPERHLPALRALRGAALAPAALRPVARGAGALDIAGPANPSDMAQVPPLIKAYLRAGAKVGEGAWIDRAFNTIDVCLVLELAKMRPPQAVRALSLAAP